MATIDDLVQGFLAQKVIAIAEMSDGSFWSDTQEVIVTLAACLEDPTI